MSRPRRSDYRLDKRERAKELYVNEGRAMSAIGDELGVSRERVRQYLQEMGVRRRVPGRRYERG